MYSDEFDDLEEARRGPRRAYVSSVSQHDADRLLRENERLKKSLEKEKFFNRLLDQELKEVKEEAAGRLPDNYHRNTQGGVSRRAFNTLLWICLALAGFIAYTLYFNKQYNLFHRAPLSVMPAPAGGSSPESDDPPAGRTDAAQAAVGLPEKTQPPASAANPGSAGSVAANAANTSANTGQQSVPVSPAANSGRNVTPNTVGQAATPSPATSRNRRPAPTSAESEYNEAEVEAVLADLPPEDDPVINIPAARQTPPPVDRRPVIGRYYVTSKANFYSSPDENTLRSVFINHGADKVVAALEDRNGFIYVEYKNDRGYTTRGWLSKKDLTKAD